MPNVLVIGKYYAPFRGGIEANTQSICEALAATGCKVTALVNNHEPGDREEMLKGVRVIRRHVAIRAKSQPISWRLLSGVDLGQYDLIHFHAPNPYAAALLVFALAVSRDRPRLVITHHMDIVGRSTLRKLTLPIYHLLIALSSAVIVTSEKNAALSRDLPAKTEILPVPLGVTPNDYLVPTEERERAHEWKRAMVGDAPLVAFVGRHARYKGLPVLIEAVAMLPGVHAAIAGDGPLRRKAEKLARRKRLNARVHFLGEISHAEKLRLLAACDVFAFPSTDVAEAFGVSQLEAMAVGAPVVATDLPTGVTDVAVDGVTALNARAGDAHDLAEKISRLLSDTELATSLARTAQRRVATTFAADVVTARARNILLAAAARHGEPAPRLPASLQYA